MEELLVASTTLFLVRHGETSFNHLGRYQGHQDIPLNDTGRLQARLAAEKLKEARCDFLWSSDLSRARETAQIIGKATSLKVKEDPRLREIAFGQWEGLSPLEISKTWPEELDKWRTDPAKARVPGGEALLEVVTRVMDCLNDLAALHRNERGIVVLHGGPIRLIAATILGLDLQNRYLIPIDNGAITTIKKAKGQWLLLGINDHCHLPTPPEGGGYEV